jgi:hypothetical protein
MLAAVLPSQYEMARDLTGFGGVFIRKRSPERQYSSFLKECPDMGHRPLVDDHGKRKAGNLFHKKGLGSL